MKCYSIFIFSMLLSLSAFSQKESSPFNIYGPPGSFEYTTVRDAVKDAEQVYKLNLTNEVPDKHFAKLAKLTNLQALQIGSNGFTEFPQEFKHYYNLLFFSTKGNPIESLPAEVGSWNLLMYAELYDTSLDSLPREIGGWSRLKSLQIQNNISDSLKLPETLFMLPSLNDILVYNSPLAPIKFDNPQSKNLKRITLMKCGLKSFPVSICRIKQLEMLSLDDNQISELPEQITKLRNLRYLSIKNNNISHITENISYLKKLETLDLRGNPFSDYDADIIRALLPNCKVILK